MSTSNKKSSTGSALLAGLSRVGPAAALVSGNLCLFGAFEIYVNNAPEFDVPFGDALPLLSVAFLILTALLMVPAVVVRPRARDTYAVVVFVLGVLLWVQGSFLRWNYGELDGRGIDWAAAPWRLWVDLSVWVVAAAVAVFVRRRLVRYVGYAAAVLVALQGLFMMVRWPNLKTPELELQKRSERWAESVPSELCRLSATSNTFHIIMDSFQTDIFLELVEAEGYEDDLDGFVVYENNLAVAWRTALCIPAIFSGRVFDGSTSESDYFRASMDHSFHNVLYDDGYVVNLIPHMVMQLTRYTNYFPSPALYGASPEVQQRRAAAYLIDVSAFRQSPHIVKRQIYNDENWRLSGAFGEPPSHQSFHQKAFFADYIRRLEKTGGSKPAYHFIHLMPPHPPYVTMADGTYSGEVLPLTRENAKHEARYVLSLFIDFVDRLKRLGVYDESVILLQGDHGAGFGPNVEGGRASDRVGRVSALMAIKVPRARGEMQLSSAPTTIADVPATIVDVLGVKANYPGRSIVSLDAGPRTREFVFVAERSSASPILNRWQVDGEVTNTAKWRELEPRRIVRLVRDYKWGQEVAFGVAGDGEAYLTVGWSTTSPTIHWNDGNTAQMTFGVTPPPMDVNLRFVFRPNVVPGKVDQQRVRIKVNGHEFGEAAVTGRTGINMDVLVPKSVLDSDRMVVSFEFPDAISPADMGTGRDKRKMAIGMYGFVSTLVDANGVPVRSAP